MYSERRPDISVPLDRSELSSRAVSGRIVIDMVSAAVTIAAGVVMIGWSLWKVWCERALLMSGIFFNARVLAVEGSLRKRVRVRGFPPFDGAERQLSATSRSFRPKVGEIIDVVAEAANPGARASALADMTFVKLRD
jgi:hypothetical protein